MACDSERNACTHFHALCPIRAISMSGPSHGKSSHDVVPHPRSHCQPSSLLSNSRWMIALWANVSVLPLSGRCHLDHHSPSFSSRVGLTTHHGSQIRSTARSLGASLCYIATPAVLLHFLADPDAVLRSTDPRLVNQFATIEAQEHSEAGPRRGRKRHTGFQR